MYEAKYTKYITKSKSRFATAEEIKDVCVPISKDKKGAGCGAALFYENGKLYVDNSDAHYYIQGQTGSKKSRVVETNIINSIIDAGENMVVNDPKGEAYARTASHAEEEGYNVFALNFRDVTKSNGWNPLSLSYNLFKQGNIPDAEQAINDFVEAVIAPSKETTNDIYWPENASFILTYCSELLMDSVPTECFNMSNVIQLTHECNEPILKDILSKMDQTSSVAITMHSILDLVAEKTSSCIYSALKQALKPFIQNNSLLELLCRNDIDFGTLTKGKTAIYIIYPDEKTSLNFLISLFFTQCYQYLVSYSAQFSDSRLPLRVNFVLDEFSNLPAVENFENRISEARGHNIRYFLFGQSYGQLKNKYKENSDTIISNCDWIVFPSKEYNFLEMVSRMCGREYDYYGIEHDLVSTCEMQHLKKFHDGAEALILKSGQYPFITKLPDFEYIDVFEKYPPAQLNKVKSHFEPVFFTVSDWVSGVNNHTYSFPFPKRK
ncbi:MAG: type IV secretory system conjugative DNA transfer family protein [Acutalibacteraceae bacterium]